jgi:prophage tail gpP-like protein
MADTTTAVTDREVSITFDPSVEGAPNIKLTGWQGLQVTRGIDQAANGFAFSMPWEPERIIGEGQKAKDVFVPYRGDRVVVRLGDEPVIDAFVEDYAVNYASGRSKMKLQGRSTTARLVDSSVHTFQFSKDSSFESIANDVARGPKDPNITAESGFVTITANPNPTIPTESSAEPGQSIFDFLSGLAAAQGLYAIPRVNAKGEGFLEFTQLDSTRAPVADLIEGVAPLQTLDTKHDMTKRFSKHIAIEEKDGESSFAEAQDDDVQPWIRWWNVDQPQQASSDLDRAARHMLSRSLIDSYTASATVTGWEHAGRIWSAGDIVRVHAPRAMVYNPTRMIIQRATLQFDSRGGKQTRLDLSLPEVYDNKPVRQRPWQV